MAERPIVNHDLWIDYFLESEDGFPIAVGRQKFPTWNMFINFRETLQMFGFVVPAVFFINDRDEPIEPLDQEEERNTMAQRELVKARLNVLKQLEPLFTRAKKEGLWFYNRYKGVLFSPQRLRGEHKAGRYIWGPDHWELRPPSLK